MSILLFLLCTLALAGDEVVLAEAAAPRVARAQQVGELPGDVEPAPRHDRVDPRAMRITSERALDFDQTVRALEPFRRQLDQLLAQETWHMGPTHPDPALTLVSEDLLVVMEGLDEDWVGVEPREIQSGVATRLTGPIDALGGSITLTRSTYKARFDDNDRPLAAAFTVQRAVRGRGTSVTDTEFLVTFRDGDPSELYVRWAHPWTKDTVERRLVVERDPSGRLVRATETRLSRQTDWSNEEREKVTTATQTVWSRT